MKNSRESNNNSSKPQKKIRCASPTIRDPRIERENMRNNVTKLAVALATAMGWLAFNAVPALAQYSQVNLTGYQPGMGRFLDPKLNGWGMVSLADGSFCVANASTGVATFY